MQDLHLLVVEDELQLAKNLARGLGEQGFSVLNTASAEAAEQAMENGAFDAIVLDLRLPRKDGLDFLCELRAAGNDTPVLVLTARGSLEERVIGLDRGADDYLTKPFAFPELVARIRAIVRRRGDNQPTILKTADLELDTIRRRGSCAGNDLNLSPKETILLELLMRNAGQVVTRGMIAEVVWGSHYNDFTNLIEVFVKRLRQKIGESGSETSIVTIRGVGYSMRKTSGGEAN
jgi:two-component system, OmpR family, response regulator